MNSVFYRCIDNNFSDFNYQNRDSIVDFSSSVQGASSKDVMDLLVLNQYFDTLQQVGGRHDSKVVFLNSNAPELTKAIMQGNAGL